MKNSLCLCVFVSLWFSLLIGSLIAVSAAYRQFRAIFFSIFIVDFDLLYSYFQLVPAAVQTAGGGETKTVLMPEFFLDGGNGNVQFRHITREECLSTRYLCEILQ